VLENVSAEARELGGFKNLTKDEVRSLADKHTKVYISSFSAGMS
jgi:hypothetical protein